MTRRDPTPPTPRSLVGVSTDRHRRVIRGGTKNASSGKRTGNRARPSNIHVLTQHREAGKLSRPRTWPIDSVTIQIFFVTTGPRIILPALTRIRVQLAREDAVHERGIPSSLSCLDFGNSAGSGRSAAYRSTINNGLSPRFSRFPMIYRPGYPTEKQVETLRDANTSTLIINRRC